MGNEIDMKGPCFEVPDWNVVVMGELKRLKNLLKCIQVFIVSISSI